MKKLTATRVLSWLTLFIVFWSLGWFSHHLWNNKAKQEATNNQSQALQLAPLEKNKIETFANKDSLLATDHLKLITALLKENNFSSALEYFESLQKTASDSVIQQAKNLVFSHARELINSSHYRLAEQLLNQYLQTSFRDVEARLLLTDINVFEKQFHTAINILYEAKGYAYRTEIIELITKRIRTTVSEHAQRLQRENNREELFQFYKHLTQLEPDYAPYFIKLATEQLALNDTSGARRSLQLVTHDQNVGLQAQELLNKVAHFEQQKNKTSATVKTINIPLIRTGDHFLVDAQLNDLQHVRLLIDTGASMTILTPNILNSRNISYIDTGKTTLFNTANGQVKAPIYEIESLTLGEWQVNQIEVGIMPLGNETMFNGLLGMNFLKHFQFFIDQNNAQLRLQGTIE